MSTALWNDEQERPLQHLTVLDLTVMLPGPYLTRILAQYGAEVIKVENMPQGDPIRLLSDTAMADWLGQGKRSVAINLKSDAGIELVKQMVAEVDVFVENFRDGVMDGLGLGYAELSEINPELLYVSLRGFQGKNAPKAGHDLNFVATSGCGDWFLDHGPNYATHWGDLIGGTLAPAVKILAHLSNPDRRGMQLVSYMDESFRSVFLHRAFDAIKAEGISEERRAAFGSHATFNGSQAHSRYYKCQDGQWVAVNAVQPKHWDRFCETVGQPAWRGRGNDPGIVEELSRLFESQPGPYWEALMATHDACVFKVVTWQEHLAETGARAQLATDPLTWAGFPANAQLVPAGEMGKDSYAVLQAIGLSDKEFDDYVRDGVVAQPGSAKKIAP